MTSHSLADLLCMVMVVVPCIMLWFGITSIFAIVQEESMNRIKGIGLDWTTTVKLILDIILIIVGSAWLTFYIAWMGLVTPIA